MKYLVILITFVAFLGAENYYTREPFQDHHICQGLAEKNITLIAMRHGEAVHNVEGIVTSSLSEEYHLTELGKEQASKSAKSLQEVLTPDFILVSPLCRTKQTAVIVADVMGIDGDQIFISEDLRESRFGIMEGKHRSEWPAIVDEKKLFRTPFAEGVETTVELFDRIHSLLWHIVNDPIFEGKTILFITHNWPCRQVNMCLKGTFGEKQPTAGYTIYFPN